MIKVSMESKIFLEIRKDVWWPICCTIRANCNAHAYRKIFRSIEANINSQIQWELWGKVYDSKSYLK